MDLLAEHAARTLAHEPDLAVSMDRLHGRLATQLGAGPRGLERLRRILEGHPGHFRILEATCAGWPDHLWDEATRARYEPALLTAGVAPSGAVTLLAREPGRPHYGAPRGSLSRLLEHLDATVLALCTAAAPHRGLSNTLRVADATRRAIRRLEPVLSAG